MQPDFTASFWARLVRTIVISSIATIAFLRMTTTQEPIDVRDVNFDPCAHFLPRGIRSAPPSSRRNSRLKAQHDKQSKLRISKRSPPEDRARRNARTSNAAYEIHLVQQALADPSIQIIHITTFTTSFDFRSIIVKKPEPSHSLSLNDQSAGASLRVESAGPAVQIERIFTLPQTRNSLDGTKIADLPNEILHMIFEQLFDPVEMSTHGRLSAFESASQVCSTWRSIILGRTFKLFYQLQKGRWRFDEFRYSPWEASFIYVPSWQLYHSDGCNCSGSEKSGIESISQKLLGEPGLLRP